MTAQAKERGGIRRLADRYRDICEWAESTLTLPPAATLNPGPLRLAPHQRGILEAFQDDDIREISMMLSGQAGKTAILLILLLYVIAVRPMPTMLVYPTQRDTRRAINTKLEPILKAHPEINDLVDRNRAGKLGEEAITFPGGYVALAHAGSLSSLSGVTAQLVICDEIDKYPGNLAGSDNPLNELRQRMTTALSTSKLVMLSTPLEHNNSLIEIEYDRGDRRRFYLNCPDPDCGVEFTTRHEFVQDGVLKCPRCGRAVSEADRQRMLQSGQWRGDRPCEGRASFHLNQFSSPFVTVADTAALEDVYDGAAFATLVLAEPIERRKLPQLEPDDIEKRLSNFRRPEWPVEAVTVGVDVQGDRLEYQVVYWTAGEGGIFIAKHAVIERTGGPEDRSCWHRLKAELDPYHPDMTFIDAGFQPDMVYQGIEDAFAAEVILGTVHPVVGSEQAKTQSWNRPLVMSVVNKWHRTLRLSVDEGKAVCQDVLRRGIAMISRPETPPEILEQLTAEHMEDEEQGSRIVRRWVKHRQRNEALDCFCYAYAARRHLPFNYGAQDAPEPDDVDNYQKEVRYG